MLSSKWIHFRRCTSIDRRAAIPLRGSRARLVVPRDDCLTGRGGGQTNEGLEVAELSAKVKEKNALNWEQAIASDLLGGEIIWAFAAVQRMKPLTIGVAITNARIVGFFAGGVTAEKRILIEVRGDDIRGFDFPANGGNMRVMTDHGEVNFGRLDKHEVDFVSYFVNHLWQHGIDPAVVNSLRERESEQSEAAAAHDQFLARRSEVQVFGSSMKDKWWEDIARFAHGDELPWLVINSGSGGRLAAFDDRLLISKSGGMTGFMAGATGGGRETIFPYSDVTNIEYNGGFVTGVLEVLTPSYQGTTNHDFWNSKNSGKDPYSLSNCLPLAKDVYRQAQPQINELHRKVADAKRSHVLVHAPAQPQAAPRASGGLADELAKLADMHQQGLLDLDEFKAAKQAAIARMS